VKETQKQPVEEPAEQVFQTEDNRATPCKMIMDYRHTEEIEGYFWIFRNSLRLGDYDHAYEYWKKAFYTAPGANGKVRYHFDDGISIFKHFYDNEQDEVKKLRWLDSIDFVYDKRLECFGETAHVAGRRAFDYYYFFSDHRSIDTIYSLFATSVDIDRKKTEYFVINPFSRLLLDLFLDGRIDTLEAKHYTNLLLDAIEYGPANCKGEVCNAWEIVKDYAPFILESFEPIPDFYPSDYYRRKYLPLYAKDITSCDSIDLIYRKLLWGSLDLNGPEFADLLEEKRTRCYVPPPEPGPLTRAFNLYNQGKYRQAIETFIEYIDRTDDIERKARYTLLISKIYYVDLKNFPMSRTWALRAADLRPGWGEPYIMIGKLYASSGPLCGPGRGWDSQIVTWPAIDKFEQARRIDPNVAAEANKLISQYEQYMPEREDIHQRLLKEGDEFRIGCWINETTRIRAARK
jgi:tetratricopeptide (TPR) repeat protein